MRIRVAIATIAIAGAAAIGLIGPAAAGAFALCSPDPPAPVLVGQVPGAIFEGAIVDPQGRLYVTDLDTGNVYRFDYPGATPTVVTTVPGGDGGAGGLAIAPDGSLLIGYGSTASVLIGDLTRPGKIERMNLTTGAITQVASGLSAADGIAVAADGTIYATNDFGDLVARISPDGVVDPEWAYLPSANGAILSADGRFLYVSRTFSDPGVSAIPTFDPGAPFSLITLNAQGQLIIPTDLGQEIVKVDGPGQICELSSAPYGSSVITYGHGASGFSAGHLYRAGFDGDIYEIPAGFDAAGH
jgi:outer membrane protein assembly factor BamB